MDGVSFDEIDGNRGKTRLSEIEVYYGLAQATLLTKHLSRKQLLDLTSQEQMRLIALSDTVASTNFDLERGDRNEISMKYSKEDQNTGKFETSLRQNRPEGQN